MEILADFGMLLYGALKSFINTAISLGIFYFILQFVIRYVICGNSQSDYKSFRKLSNAACLNYIKALGEFSRAHLDSAKLWADKRIHRNNLERKERSLK